MIDSNQKIYVAGHRGMVGGAIVRQLKTRGINNIVTRSHHELNLLDQQQTTHFFKKERPDIVVLAAAKVGGILANSTYPANFIYENLMMECNVIHQAWQCGVKEILFLGSSCIYPKFASQPLHEESLLTGLLEPTNEAYAIAKIAGIKICESYNRQYDTNYRSVMPTNLFGPGDNYHLKNSHVIPAMLRKCHLAKLAVQGDVAAISADEDKYGEIPENIAASIGYNSSEKNLNSNAEIFVELWGTGSPRREFLHVDDMASACLHVMEQDPSFFKFPRPSFVNIGTGKDMTIRDTARLVAETVGYEGEIRFNSSYPDGTPQKLLDISRLSQMGWKPRFDFSSALKSTYRNYLSR